VVDLGPEADAAEVRAWLESERIRILNVAGPRESSSEGIHARAVGFLREVLG
jgi:hypothetical protein